MKLKFKKQFFFILLFTFIFSNIFLPTNLYATQSGGGYIVYDQFNPISGAIGGGGFTSTTGGSPISEPLSGGGYTSYGGTYFYNYQPPVVIPPGGGGGGGGGGNTGYADCQDGTLTYAEVVERTPTTHANCRVDTYRERQTINIYDFNVLMVGWGTHAEDDGNRKCGGKRVADINCDYKANIYDFNIMMIYWRYPVFVF